MSIVTCNSETLHQNVWPEHRRCRPLKVNNNDDFTLVDRCMAFEIPVSKPFQEKVRHYFISSGLYHDQCKSPRKAKIPKGNGESWQVDINWNAGVRFIVAGDVATHEKFID